MVTSIFYFSHDVFRSVLAQVQETLRFFGTGLTLPNNNFLDWTKFKAFADDKLNASKIMISLSYRVEKIVGKGENAGLPAFSPFPTMFSMGFFRRVIKSRYFVVKN